MLFEGGRVVVEGAGVAGEESGEGVAHVGNAEHGVMCELVQADPQPEVVDRKAPVGGEGVDVGDDEEKSVGTGRGRVAGDRQVVGAEVAGCQASDHRAGRDVGHQGGDHLHEP